MAYEFLSEEWFAAVEALRDEAPEPPEAVRDLVVNAIVTGAPSGTCEIHVQDGQPARGLIADAPTTITIPYDVACDLFVRGDPAAAMQAFMSGAVKIEGDITRLLVLQAIAAEPAAEHLEFRERIRALTAGA